MRSRITCAALLLGTAAIPAQAAVVGVFHENLNAGNNSVFIFGSAGTSGTISGSDGLNDTFMLGSDGVFEFGFGTAGREMETSGVVNSLSYTIRSDDEANRPISALALNRGPNSTDMTTLLDTDGLGSDYIVLTHPGTFGAGSQMSVTAIEDNTVVTITPKNLRGKPDGAPFDVTLQAGESIFYNSVAANGREISDLSGTRVSANRNVAVFAGAECTQVPDGVQACDHLISQQFSTDNFDRSFRISENFGGGTDSDLVRVIASQDGTEVFLNGASRGTIDAGEVLTIDSVGNGMLTSSKPVQVGQFVRGQDGTRTTGDPAFAILPSVDQQLDGYAFSTPIGSDSFSQNFLNVAIDSTLATSLLLNGTSVDTTGFSLLDGVLYGNIDIGIGSGMIEADGAFLATISGFSGFDSYFSPIATAFSPGVSPPPPPPDVNVVPLPAAGWMLLASLGGLAAVRRRKSR